MDKGLNNFILELRALNDGVKLDHLAESLTKEWSSIKKEQRFEYIFDKVQTLTTCRNAKRIALGAPFREEWLTSTYLHSMSMDTVPLKRIVLRANNPDYSAQSQQYEGTTHDFIRRRAAQEMSIGGPFRCTKSLLAMKMAMRFCEGDDVAWETNYYVRLLVTIIHAYNGGSNLKEMFWEDKKGEIVFPNTSPCKNPAIPKITSILIKAIWDLYSGVYQHTEAVMQEVIEYILLDPYEHWRDVKKVRSVGNPMAFSTTKAGKIPQWSGSPEDGYAIIPNRYHLIADLENDLPFHDFFEDTFNETIKEYRQKLPLLCKEYARMISAPMTDANLKILSVLRGPEQIVGFVKGLHSKVVEDQIWKQEITRYSPKYHHKTYKIGTRTFLEDCKNSDCFDCELIRTWKQQYLFAYEKGISFSHSNWLSSIPSCLTSKSGGVEPGVATAFVKGENDTVSEVKVKARSKTFLFFLKPEMNLSRSYIEGLDLAHPVWKNTERSDKGRDGRMVCMTILPYYLLEQPLSRAVFFTQSLDDELSLTKQDERPFSNHVSSFQYQINNQGNVITIGLDASHMDLSTTEENVLNSRVQGTLEALNEINLPGSWGEYERLDGPEYTGGPFKGLSGLQHMVLKNFNRVGRRKFSIKDLMGVHVNMLDQLFSGENLTTATHNVTNKAKKNILMGRWRTALVEKYRQTLYSDNNLDLLYYEATGDDETMVLRFSRPFTASDIETLLRVADELGREIGILYNMYKTMARSHRMEYLKKDFVYMIMNMLSLRPSWHDDERCKFDNDLFEMVSSFQGQMGDYVSRGGDDWKCSALRNMVALLRMEYRWKTKFKAKGSNKLIEGHFQMPYSIIFVPRKLGGMGWLPNTVIGESKDAVVLWYFKEKYPFMYEHILTVAATTSSSPWRESSRFDVLEMIPDLTAGVSFVRKQLDHDRIKKAIKAAEVLRSMGRRDKDSDAYYNCPERIVRSQVKDLKDIKEIVNTRKINMKLLFKDYERKNPIKLTYTEFGYLDHIIVEMGKKLPVLFEPDVCSPVGGPISRVRTCLRTIGAFGTGNKSISPMRILAQIFDSLFPKDLRVEGLLEQIISDHNYLETGFVSNFLIMRGADEAKAIHAEQRFQDLRLNPLELQALKGWSMSDPILSLFDVSQKNQSRIVTVVGVNEASVQALLYEFGFLLSVTSHFTPCEITIKAKPSLNNYILKTMDLRTKVLQK